MSKKDEIDLLFSTPNPAKHLDRKELPSNQKNKEQESPQIEEEDDESDDMIEKNNRTLFIGNLPTTFSEKKLRKICSEFGKVETVRFRCLPFTNTKLSKTVALKRKLVDKEGTQVAYVVFAEQSSVESAMVLNNRMIDGNFLRVDHSLLPGQKFQATKEKNKKTIFIGQLSHITSENTLHTLFKECGDIEGLRLPKDKTTQRNRGVAFITFKNQKSIDLALKFHQSVLDGRTISVTRCKKVGDKKKEKNERMKEQRNKTMDQTSFEGVRSTERPNSDKQIKKYLKLKKKTYQLRKK